MNAQSAFVKSRRKYLPFARRIKKRRRTKICSKAKKGYVMKMKKLLPFIAAFLLLAAAALGIALIAGSGAAGGHSREGARFIYAPVPRHIAEDRA